MESLKCHELLAFTMVISVGFTVADETCPYKECYCLDAQVSCQNLHLTSFPVLLNRSTSLFTDVNFDNNEIQLVPANSLPQGLTDINLSHNPIGEIEPGAFNGSTSTINFFMLWQARLTRIPDEFSSFQNLQYLVIYDTPVQDWNHPAMENVCRTLVRLDLKNVSLTAWPEWFKPCSHLSELNLDVTTISTVPDDAFDQLVDTLGGLSIANGSLTTIPKSISKLKKLESLSLENNRILDVEFLPRWSRISSLSLYNNRISDEVQLSRNLRFYNQSLVSLEIQNNHLKAIPDVSFLKIESLDLSKNWITSPNAGAVPLGLSQLDLSYNFLPAVPSAYLQLKHAVSVELQYNSITTIRGLEFHPATFEIDLGHNLLSELTDTSFPVNSGIIVLQLNDNPITTVSSHAFDNLPLLITLDLSGTRLNRLPVQMAVLSSLLSLDMSDNARLTCTCSEKSLRSWILKLEIHGSCGMLSIHDFFAYYSPDCPGEKLYI